MIAGTPDIECRLSEEIKLQDFRARGLQLRTGTLLGSLFSRTAEEYQVHSDLGSGGRSRVKTSGAFGFNIGPILNPKAPLPL